MRWKWWAPSYDEQMARDRVGPATAYTHRSGAHPAWDQKTAVYPKLAPLLTPGQVSRANRRQ